MNAGDFKLQGESAKRLTNFSTNLSRRQTSAGDALRLLQISAGEPTRLRHARLPAEENAPALRSAAGSFRQRETAGKISLSCRSKRVRWPALPRPPHALFSLLMRLTDPFLPGSLPASRGRPCRAAKPLLRRAQRKPLSRQTLRDAVRPRDTAALFQLPIILDGELAGEAASNRAEGQKPSARAVPALPATAVDNHIDKERGQGLEVSVRKFW